MTDLEYTYSNDVSRTAREADHEADLARQVCGTCQLAADKAEREAETASTVGALRLALAQYREAHRAAVAWAAAEYRARCSWRAEVRRG